MEAVCHHTTNNHDSWVCPLQLTAWSEQIEIPPKLDHDHHQEQLDSSLPPMQQEPRPQPQQPQQGVLFEVDHSINSSIALWRGNPLALEVDALVHSTNERLERCTRLSDELYRQAGPELSKCLFNRVRHCPTGSVRITKG